MRLIMKCKDTIANIHVDDIDKQDDVVFAYRRQGGNMLFVGCFDLGSVDFLYVTEEK